MSKKNFVIKPVSLATEKQFQHQKKRRRAELLHAVAYCRENNCRGYKALKDPNYTYLFLKSPLTINNALDGRVCPEHTQAIRRILTESEERQVVQIIKSANR